MLKDFQHLLVLHAVRFVLLQKKQRKWEQTKKRLFLFVLKHLQKILKVWQQVKVS